MSERFGLPALREIRLGSSSEVFARRGGPDGHHRDGWVVAFREGADARVWHRPHPATTSPLVRFRERCGPASRTALSHIRRATRRDVRVSDAHPFARKLGGRICVFAHDGAVPDACARSLPGRFRPAGEIPHPPSVAGADGAAVAFRRAARVGAHPEGTRLHCRARNVRSLR